MSDRSTVSRDVNSLSRGNSDSWLTGKSDSAGDSGSELVENSTPPLVLISSRIKNPGVLASCANAGVVVVRYAYDSTTLSGLLHTISRHMRGRLALSIALLMDGKPGTAKICSQKLLTETSLREDKEVRDFFQQLVSQFLHRESQYVRLDLLLCPVASNKAGQRLLTRLKDLVEVPVYSASDILGPTISDMDESIRIGTLYFDKNRLKEQWNSQPQTMALFEKIRTVGKGAYGAAVLYRKKDDDSLVILKEINLMELSKQERTLALNEVQILSMLDHPNIISYYDNFEEDGVLMIEMEYADGGTLAQLLRQRTSPMAEQDILIIFLKMVDALRYLHEHRILHRDLKTANIFLTKEGGVKLGDFGISKVLTGTSAEAHTAVGTPFYISPEICEGKNYNAKSDIWSLGCILYEMACLERTFEGTNLPAIIHKIVKVSFPPIKGNFSEGFRELVTDMLRKDPQARPSAYELYTLRVPALMVQEEEEEEEMADTVPDDTTTKSFLYHLDCQSFLLRPISIQPIKPLIDHVSVGYGHIIAVTYEHTVYSWGDNGHGQLGHGDTMARSSPQLVETLKGRPILRTECGAEFTIFISDNNIIMSCGRGDCGALGHGPAALGDCLRPKLIEGMLSLDTVGVACGMAHTIAITSERGALYTWGDGRTGCLGNGRNELCASPCEIKVRSAGRMSELICAVRCGPDSSMFLTDSGRVYACGNNQYNKLGLNQRQTFIGQMRRIWNKGSEHVTQALEPTPIKELGKHRVIDMAIGSTHSCLVVETGKVFTFGRNDEGQLCSGSLQPSDIPVNVKALTGKPTMVTCVELATIVTTQENSFMVWGSRPLVKSPLHSLLSTQDPVLQTGQTQVANKDLKRTEPTASHKRRISSISIDLPGPRTSAESLVQLESEDKTRRTSSLNLTNTPHAMFPCSDGTNYMHTLTLCLRDQEVMRTKGAKDDVRSGAGGGSGRRGPSVSTDPGVDREGVIMEPTSLDLVGRSGVLSHLCAQGLKQPKLEGIGHCAGNVLILIEAKVSDVKEDEIEKTEKKKLETNTIRVSPPKQQLLLSKRLRDRRHVNRRKIPTPILPEFKPPQSSDFEPTLSAHLQPTRTRGDSDPPEPSHTKYFTEDTTTKSRASHETKDTNMDDMEECDLEESHVPTWILKELAQAAGEQHGGDFSHSDPTPHSRPSSNMDVEDIIDSVSSPSTPRSDISQPSCPPLVPRFFAATPDISQFAVDQKVEIEREGLRKLKQDNILKLPAPVGLRKPSVSGTSCQLRTEPIRLPTPHQRLKSALSANSIATRNSGNILSCSELMSSKVLNVKKASSNVDLVARPTMSRTGLPRQQSIPKIQSQLTQVSVSSQPRQVGSSCPRTSESKQLKDSNDTLATEKQSDKSNSFMLENQFSSTESMDRTFVLPKGTNNELSALPRLANRRTKNSNSSLQSKICTTDSQVSAHSGMEQEKYAVELDREKAAKKEEEMQEEIKKLKENLDLQKTQLMRNDEAMKELKEQIQTLQATPSETSQRPGQATASGTSQRPGQATASGTSQRPVLDAKMAKKNSKHSISERGSSAQSVSTNTNTGKNKVWSTICVLS